MKQIFKDPTARANLPFHGFPMEQNKVITAAFGQLLPVYYDILNAGEKIRFKSRWFTRTQPLSTAAMVRVREHVEYFFVPFEQLYSIFGSFRYGILDLHSTLIDETLVSDKLPTTRLSVIFDWVSQHHDYICGNLKRAGDSADDVLFDSLWNGAYRLFDLLQCGEEVFHAGDYASSNLSLSFYMLAAYQKIFNDVYRLDDYTKPIVDGFNMDSGYDGTWVPNYFNLLSLRYRPFYKDYFTSSSPSPLVNGTSMLGQDDQSQVLAKVNQWLTDSEFGLTSSSIVQSSSPNFELGNIQVSSGTSQNISPAYSSSLAAVSAPQIRTMFAIEKLAEITGRAGKHYDEQTLAHFGFEVPRGISGEVFRLGGQSQTLQIGEVVGTATTENSVLGEIAGKAYSVTQNADDNEFTAPVDGIFMAVYSAVPELNYLSRLDKLNTKVNRYDFYLPELDKLGKQPLFGYEYCGGAMNPTIRSRVTAWSWRYLESKTKYNITTHAFTDGGPFADWTVHMDVNDVGFDMDETTLYCNPRVLNDIFLVNYDNQPQWPYETATEENPVSDADIANACYATDSLIINFDFDISKASTMSPYGIPNL